MYKEERIEGNFIVPRNHKLGNEVFVLESLLVEIYNIILNIILYYYPMYFIIRNSMYI